MTIPRESQPIGMHFCISKENDNQNGRERAPVPSEGHRDKVAKTGFGWSAYRKIVPPAGKFGTFHLALVEGEARKAEFRFSSPRIFVGVDICDDGPEEAALTIRSPDQKEQTVTLRAGELRRVRTEWTVPVTQVGFGFQKAGALHFDNLAYAQGQ